jgi:hypothetical protein
MTDSGDMRHGLEAFGDCAGCVRSAILRVVDAKAEPGKRHDPWGGGPTRPSMRR